MAQAPIMPIFTDALIGDTTHLSTEQFGAYVLILLATWRNNGKALPDDDTRMSRICHSTVTRFRRRIRPVLCELFFINESGWHQLRLEKEWKRVELMLDLRRATGALGGAASAKQTRSKRSSKTAATQTYIEEESLTSSEGEVAARAHELREAAPRTRDVAIATPKVNGRRMRSFKQVIDAINVSIPPVPGRA